MKRGHGTSGSSPLLTAEQRERIKRVVGRRWEIKAAIKALEAELASLPTNAELVAEYGVCVQTLHAAARKNYRNRNKLDKVPRETSLTTQQGTP